MLSVDEFKTKLRAIMEGTDLPFRNRVEVIAVKNGKVEEFLSLLKPIALLKSL